MAFDLNLESYGGNYHFMVRHMVGGVKHSSVKNRGVKLTVHEDKILQMTRSRAVTIVILSRLMEWFVLELCL